MNLITKRRCLSHHYHELTTIILHVSYSTSALENLRLLDDPWTCGPPRNFSHNVLPLRTSHLVLPAPFAVSKIGGPSFR